MEENDHLDDAAYEWFSTNRDAVIAGHHGEQVVIMDDKVIGYFLTPGDACEYMKAHGFEGGYAVQDCVDEEEEADLYQTGYMEFAANAD
jgi:hypothetical protein